MSNPCLRVVRDGTARRCLLPWAHLGDCTIESLIAERNAYKKALESITVIGCSYHCVERNYSPSYRCYVCRAKDALDAYEIICDAPLVPLVAGTYRCNKPWGHGDSHAWSGVRAAQQKARAGL